MKIISIKNGIVEIKKQNDQTPKNTNEKNEGL